jgi:cytochrome b
MSAEHQREVNIWDVPTRLFHWLLVLLVGTNLFLIGPDGGVETVIHMVAGYGVAGLLLFRLAWGLVGSPRSRFADFVRPWPAVKAYVERLLRLQPSLAVGHNPLGGWMVIILLAVLAAMVVTGVFASGRQAAGPFAHLIPVDLTAVAGDIHEFVANILIALIVVHLAGVAVDWFLTRENLVKAMINGRKRLPAEIATEEPPVVGVGRAAIVGAVSLLLFGVLVAVTDFSASRASLQGEQIGTMGAGDVANTSSAADLD